MRQVINPQRQFGEQDKSAIEFDPKSRDDIPQILRGLQYIYTTRELRERVFAILAEVIPVSTLDGKDASADASTGRPGMEQWKILMLGTLRLGLNADIDRIHELANQHNMLRQMLGRCDSFVVETNIHYPTDINLLFDAMRRSIEVCARRSTVHPPAAPSFRGGIGDQCA